MRNIGVSMLNFYRAEVIRILDGDTLEAEIDLGFKIKITTMIRLQDVYAPEVRTTDYDEKLSGIKIKNLLEDMIANNGNIIFVRTYKTGSFKRWIGKCYLDANMQESINEAVNEWVLVEENKKP